MPLRSLMVVVAILLAFCGGEGYAQLQVWRHLNTEGMFNANIVCMTEGADGLMYLGTHDGVDVFDGRRFAHINVPELIEKGINPFTNQMRWGRGGMLWVCTRTHVYTYDPASGNVQVLYGNGSVPAVGNIEVDTQRNLLYFIDAGDLKTFRIKDTAIEEMARMTVGNVLESRMSAAGELYLMTDYRKVVKLENGRLADVFEDPGIIDMDYSVRTNSIMVLCSKGLVSIDCSFGRAEQLPAKNVWPFETSKSRLTVFADGRVLVHHPQGIDLFVHMRDTVPVRFSADERNPASLRENFVITAYGDRKGNIWISENGINLSVLPANALHTGYVSEKMTGATRIWVSYHDSAHHQVLTSSELGICRMRYNGDTPVVTAGIKPRGMKFFEPMAFEPWYREELLVLTNGQGPWLLHTGTLTLRPFDTLVRYGKNKNSRGIRLISPGKYLVFGPMGMYVFDRVRGTFMVPFRDTSAGNADTLKQGILSATVDNHGQVWAADGASLHVFDSTLHPVKVYVGKSAKNRSGLANTVIMDVRQAPDGDMYLTTMGSGLMRLTPADTFEQVKLVGDITSVFCIGLLDSTHLLITSGNGLILYDLRTRTSRVMSQGYGLPVTDFNQYALAIDNRFVMTSGTKGHLVMDRGNLVSAFSDTASLLVMNGMRVQHNIVLNKGVQTMDLDVTITGYLASADWKIRYKLDGLEEEWRELGKGEWKIRYNSIAPGSYTLRVEALDAGNVIYVPALAIPVTALPYFWQTVWFRLLMVAIAISILVITVRFFSQLQLKWKLKKLEDEQKIARERIRISRELHDNVGSQLTYLISGLESSNMLLQKQETEKLEQKIGKMQSSARESMQQLRDSIWALNTESVQASVLLSRFRSWLENIIEAAPGTNYVVQSDISNDTELDPIRSLNLFRIMQEAVHNVLKHAQASMLSVTYTCTGAKLVITIEDDGKGFDMEGKPGNGRRSMAARAEEMGAELTLVSTPGKGTKMMMEVKV